jgi:NitT/TauT family transport system substrate-binding protein
MPANGPQTVLQVEKLAGKVKGNVDLSKTYTNQFVDVAKQQLGLK